MDHATIETDADTGNSAPEARAWLEAHCPPDAPADAQRGRICWGGRHFIHEPGAARVDAVHGRARLDRCRVAARVRRRRADEARPKACGPRCALGCRSPLDSFGIWMLGPALLKAFRGAKREHPPRIARGEIRWCQGYPELGAGSGPRVAATAPSCATTITSSSTGRRSGPPTPTRRLDLLPRAHDTGAKKHTGISFLLFDMQTGRDDAAGSCSSRQVPVLRDLLSTTLRPAGQPRRRAERQAGRSPAPSDPRAQR